MPLLMCPNDSSSMQTVQRAGVEFDMCPTCRGVWLDRGELEKLMNASRTGDEDARPRDLQPPRRDRDDDDRYERREPDHRKRRGFDLFDIFARRTIDRSASTVKSRVATRDKQRQAPSGPDVAFPNRLKPRGRCQQPAPFPRP